MGGETRAVSEPTTQTVVRGPKEGFVESLFTNISLVRRRIKSSDLYTGDVPSGKHVSHECSHAVHEEYCKSRRRR
ncbi:spore germination protein [Paenibacillus polymyxa]|uniref:spore germination protein n=1 Tax=Paenibacillus polymyxa TaxID=1406 RepID=UPI0037CBEAD2